MTSVSAVVVAGGKGERMQSDIRKQYLMLDGLPILSRTLLALSEISIIDKIFLAVPEIDFDFCTRRIIPFVQNRLPVELVPGGKNRQQSVFNALSVIPDPETIVAIHDGVRPFVPVPQTQAAIRWAGQDGACILGLCAVDTLKSVDRDGYITATMPRTGVWQAQTPQVFQLRIIRQAHEYALSTGFSGTDDASLVENAGGRVRIIPGSSSNIKITQPEDLAIAMGILKQRQDKVDSQKQ